MGFVGLVHKLRSLHHRQHTHNDKRDDSTFDSNELYDIVSLMETEGGDIEQALSHQPTAEQEMYESMEVILPSTWTLDKKRRLGSSGASEAVTADGQGGVAASEAAQSLIPLVNLGVIKIESETITEECYEVERAQDESENVDIWKDPLAKHPISEIAVAIPFNDIRGESSGQGDEVKAMTVKEESDLEQNHQYQGDLEEDDGWMEAGMTPEETQKRFMEDLKEIAKKHMATTSESYAPADILVDDCATVMLEDEDGDEGGRMSAIQSLVMSVIEATASVITCSPRASKKGPPPVIDSSEIARAILERERSIDQIVNELQGDTPKVIDATKQQSNQQRCDYEWEKDRRRRIVDDDSTISTHLSMQLDTDYNF